MGIVYTSTGNGAQLWNFPDSEPGTLTPNDFIVTAANATSGTFSFESDLGTITIQTTGQFSNYEGAVGRSLGEVSQTLTGSISTETATISIGDTQYVDKLAYDPPLTVEPVNSLQQTLSELQDEWSGDDTFIGDRNIPQPDAVYGYGGNDRFVMTYSDGAAEKFRGGDGVDTAVFESNSEHWNIIPTTNAWNTLSQQTDLTGYNVTDSRFVGTDTYGEFGHILQIVEVERLEFSDKKVALDFDRGENSFKAAALIATIFGAENISTYFAPAIDLIDQGVTEVQIAQLVIDLGLLNVSSNEQFVSDIYENVVGITPDPLTQAIYANQLNSGELTHSGLIAIGANASIVESQMPELDVWRENGLDYFGF